MLSDLISKAPPHRGCKHRRSQTASSHRKAARVARTGHKTLSSSCSSSGDNLGGNKMEGRPSKEISSAEAVLVGALSSGVNAPTWFVLKITFLLLAICFTAMLSLAFSSKNFVIVGHVLLLVTIGTVLFVLLNRFLAEVGLVPVEQQMQEIGIHKTEATDRDKRN